MVYTLIHTKTYTNTHTNTHTHTQQRKGKEKEREKEREREGRLYFFEPNKLSQLIISSEIEANDAIESHTSMFLIVDKQITGRVKHSLFVL